MMLHASQLAAGFIPAARLPWTAAGKKSRASWTLVRITRAHVGWLVQASTHDC